MYQGDYIPSAPVNDDARERNGNLPNGGIYNYVNLHVYHYGANNPIKYVDPTGRSNVDVVIAVSIEKNIFKRGAHVMILYRDKVNPTRNVMLDISGNYMTANRRRSTATGVLTPSMGIPIQLENYIGYFKETDPKKEILHTYTITMGRDDLEKIRKAILNVDSNPWLGCAQIASEVLESTGLFPGITQTPRPKDVKSYFDNFMNNLPEDSNITITHETWDLTEPHTRSQWSSNEYGDKY
jgi:hypothetical protein